MTRTRIDTPPETIAVTTAATDAAPCAGVSGGSKTTDTVGLAVQRAAEDARRQMLAIAADHLEAAVEDLELVDGAVRVVGAPAAAVTLARIAGMSTDFGQKYEPVYGRGASALTDRSPVFAAYPAEVAVDDETGEARVTRFVAVQDVRFAINPAAVEGQIHGGVAQRIGWALSEGLGYDGEGEPLTATLTDYALPRAPMLPPIETVLLEIPSPHGPFGAKGVGEPPAIPGPAAVANATRDAAGVRATALPITPESLVRGLWEANGRRSG